MDTMHWNAETGEYMAMVDELGAAVITWQDDDGYELVIVLSEDSYYSTRPGTFTIGTINL